MKGSPYLAGAFPAFFVFVLILWISETPSKYLTATFMALISFLVYLYVFGDLKRSITISLSAAQKLIITSLLIVLSLLIILPTTPFDTELYLDWSVIPFFEYLRFAAATFLLIFFPGYVTMKLLDRKRLLSNSARLVFSFIISLFYITIGLFILLRLDVTFAGLTENRLLLLSSVSFALLIANWYASRSDIVDASSTYSATFQLSHLILAIVALFFVTTALIFTRQSMMKIIDLDAWRTLGPSLGLLRGDQFPTYISKGVVTSNYPWPKFLILAFTIYVTNLPPVNALMLIGIFDVTPILAFFVMVSAFYRRESKIPILSTLVWALFSGFAWLFTVLQPYATSYGSWYDYLISIIMKTDEDVTRPNSLYNIFLDPYFPMLYGLTCFFLLVYLVRKENISPKSAFILVLSTATFGYLFHIAEVLIFTLILPLLAVFLKRERTLRIMVVSSSMLSSLLIISVIDLFSPARFYISTLSHYLAIITSAAALILSIIRIRHRSGITILSPKLSGSIKSRVSLALLIPTICVWFLSFFVLDYVSSTGELTFGDYGALPWYIYPLRLGIAGLLTLSVITYFVIHRRKLRPQLKFFGTLSSALFLIGTAVTYVNYNWFFTGYFETRFLPFVFIGVSVFAAFAIERFSFWTRSRKSRSRILSRKVMSIALFALIFSTGVSSTILAVDYASLAHSSYFSPNFQGISESELEALNYVRLNITRDAVIMTMTTDSLSLLNCFSGVYQAFFPSPGLNLNDTAVVLGVMANPLPSFGVGQVRYIYLAKRDIQYLEPWNNSYITRFIGVLPIVFENSEVIVRYVPPLWLSNDSGSNGRSHNVLVSEVTICT